MLGKASRP